MKRKYRKKRPNLALLAVVAAMLPAGFLLTSNRGEGAATDTAASVELAPPEGGRVAVALGAEALVQVEVEEQDDELQAELAAEAREPAPVAPIVESLPTVEEPAQPSEEEAAAVAAEKRSS